VLVAVALVLGVWALTANRPGNFNVRPEPKADGVLVTGGPYRHVRHPMYLALLVAMAGFCIGYGTPWRWVALAVLACVLGIKIGIEERAMTVGHPDYATYAQRTKRLFPFVW
jgi:protein-S-isoprenylcysteine O-methyltransferase Ste14